MKRILISYGIIMSFFLTQSIKGQELTQVIRGKIVDVESEVPLPFATISIQTISPPMGTTSDNDGYFRFNKVPVGRHNIQVSFIGYETKLIPELMVTSGKEMVLTIKLKESISQVEEVVVKAFAKKDKPLNNMATLSARTFSVEEAQRYAGGFDDPARLASSFAGVSTGYLDDNGIIVRGNAPKGLLWRLEGVEIPNPNHFTGMTTFGGGGVSALSSLMLANSDFYTGAFPAEYGNAMSGVFDIKLRTGNNEKHEHAFQAGFLGVDLSSEGPLSKNHKGSYLFNYRYSTFGIIKPILPADANIPVYQDLCFKINLPTSKTGTFSLWGLGTDDKISFDAELDTSLWRTYEDHEVGEAEQRMGVLGLNHKIILGKKTYLHSTFALAGDYTIIGGGELDYDLNRTETESIDYNNYRFTFASTLNHKFGAKHSNRTGIIANNYHYNTLIKYAPEAYDDLIVGVDETGSSNMVQMFTQSRIDLSKSLNLNIGLHSFYFDLNKELTFEPRIGVSYNFTKSASLSLAYGNHSQLEPQTIYFANVVKNGINTQPNKDLDLSKAHHFVLAYDFSIKPNLRLKVEPYIQLLYDVPITPDSTYSTINMDAEWFFSEELKNDGTGTNYGLDITLERFLKEGYYYLFTASVFESKYVAGDNIERQTRYSTNFVVNALFGKEWVLGAKNNKIIGINARLNVLGGQRITPVDVSLSHDNKYIVYDNSRPFEDSKPTVFHLNTSITYRINKKNHSSILALQVLNTLGAKEHYGPIYDYRDNVIFEDKNTVIIPSLSYKIEF